MEKIYINWNKIKSYVNNQQGLLRYEENDEDYYIWIEIGNREYYTSISKNTADATEFLTYYKPIADKPINPTTDDGKIFIRAESRPLNTNVYFTGIGDSESNIGDGKEFSWDFTNQDDEIEAPEGYRRKRIEFKFLDNVWIKEGTLYFYDMPKGSYGDMYIVAPIGTPYYDNNGEVQVALEDTIIQHYVMHHRMEGTVAMGDELNTECCSDEIPNFYKFWIEVTIPDTENSEAHGNFDIELYRTRNIIL